jgi:hypothetical protein
MWSAAAAEVDVVVEVDDAVEDDDDDGDDFSLPPHAVATVSTAVSPIPTPKIRTTLIVCSISMTLFVRHSSPAQQYLWSPVLGRAFRRESNGSG